MFGLLVAQGAFAMLVLCVGGSSHFAMETTHAPSAQHGDASACQDVSVLVAAEKPSRSDAQSGLALDDLKSALTLDAIPLQAEVNTPFRRPWRDAAPVGNPVLPALRTVILLT